MTYTEQEYELMAIYAIKRYLNKEFTDDEVKSNYSLALKRLINNSKDMESYKKAGVKTVSEGNQSISFDAEPFTITPDIKVLLPAPFVRMW